MRSQGIADGYDVSAYPGHGTGTGFRRNVGGGPSAAGRARRALSSLHAELDGPVLDSVRLLVTELVTNAIRHAGAPTVELLVELGSASVYVEVANAGGGFQAKPKSDQDSGWGLFLVDRLSDRWGVDDEPGRQRVWFELARV